MTNKIKIYLKGEKVLREKAQEVPIDKITGKKFQNIIKKLKKVIAENEEALAVAAPQIGESWRITVINWNSKNMVFVNPKIINSSKTKKDFPEGCLSVPKVFDKINRAEKVKVEAYNEKSKKFQRGASGLLAQTLQHEIDHLDGILFIDKTHEK